jgi:hypothetical protein
MEPRLSLTGNIAVTNAFLVDWYDKRLTGNPPLGAGQAVSVEVDFTTQGLPSNASYDISFTVDGHTKSSNTVSWGAGDGPSQDWWSYYLTVWVARPGTNQVSVTVDPAHSVPETSYADNTMSFSFTAGQAAVGSSLPYTVSQIRDAYGINSIPHIGTRAADGSGQTIALDEAGNEPTIMTDLDGFDEGMYLTTAAASQSLYGVGACHGSRRQDRYH